MLDQSKPVYQRLRDVIANAILDGTYADGDMLPSVRSLAAEEGANPLTVAKATNPELFKTLKKEARAKRKERVAH